jgi:hypothetical protein
MLLSSSTTLTSAQQSTGARQSAPQLGGSYASLDARRQRLINDWVMRFNAVTKRKMQPDFFYDTYVKLSTKTTFDAITYALERTTLTDSSGQRIGDALDLIERIESTHGEIAGASGDRQFRMYVMLTENAIDTLGRSKEFKRAPTTASITRVIPSTTDSRAALRRSRFLSRWINDVLTSMSTIARRAFRSVSSTAI